MSYRPGVLPNIEVGDMITGLESHAMQSSHMIPDPRTHVEGPVTFHGVVKSARSEIVLRSAGREIGDSKKYEVDLKSRTTTVWFVLRIGECIPDVFEDALSVIGLELEP